MAALYDHPDWRLRACRGQDPAIWYPGESSILEAQRICHTCPVEATCLEVALANGEDHGIWGGVSEKGRRRILRQRRLAAA